MDVDDPPGEPSAQLRRQDLHVPREHDQFDIVLLDDLEHARLKRVLRLRRRHRVRLEWHPVEGGKILKYRMIAQYEWDLDRQLARPLAEQKVVEAVRRRRYEHQGAERSANHIELPRHRVAFRDLRDSCLEVGALCIRLHLEAHEEGAGVFARELLRLGDVAGCLDDGTADRVHDARFVGADDREHPVCRGWGGGVESHTPRLWPGYRRPVPAAAGALGLAGAQGARIPGKTHRRTPPHFQRH